MKKLLIPIIAVVCFLGACTGGDDGDDPGTQNPNFYGTLSVNSIDYDAEISIAGQTLPIAGTSSESSSMTFRDDKTCDWDINVKTEDISILGQTIPGQDVALTGSGTFTYTESDGTVTQVVVTDTTTLTFNVIIDMPNSQKWAVTVPYTVPLLGEIDIDLVMNMTK